ncbi:MULTISPECIES: RDD family protein [Acinetobacter]|uniref:RDD family protein n=1 Tax=Acinetobacter indicus TaxID=756892 RepID=A0A7S7AFD4_9GAMM|nr:MULTISPECIES: RDD family protein [Acinetobacter]MCO8087124.1 RDD family protein [Acinetobacter indicus]MCO8099250.1 RDD family protein [Acinetobacter indicus]MCO8102177.1 RDD family protein [Acinetobacter indicus]MCO8104823.1 RDD family protein [Acinetobacter indicus]MCO8110497.1 RDD family protein [Acinetobacter indicus]
MQIYLARNNQQAGPYTLEQVNQMLASQQVLLTDLAWHQGMTEWKALGELTQGKLVYQPEGYEPAPAAPEASPFQQPQNTASYNNSSLNQPQAKATQTELASIGTRALAKIIDLLLWLPAAAIPSFFLTQDQFGQLSELQQKMQSATSSDQAVQLQSELFRLIPADAWQMMAIYLLIMLGIQAFLLAKSGQSIGKRLTKIKIVDAEDHSKVGLTRVFALRTLVFIILNLLFMPFITIADYIFALGEKRQTLHDKLAKTKVVKQEK